MNKQESNCRFFIYIPTFILFTNVFIFVKKTDISLSNYRVLMLET